jgi:hypothetical protein
MTVDTTSGSGFAGGDAVEAGLERARQHGIYSSRSEIRNELDALTRVVQEWPEELSTRFVELITEQVTVASVARRYSAIHIWTTNRSGRTSVTRSHSSTVGDTVDLGTFLPDYCGSQGTNRAGRRHHEHRVALDAAVHICGVA